MERFWPRFVLVVIVWFEVSRELDIVGSTAFVMTLVAVGGALMWWGWPERWFGALEPRMAVLVWPMVLWAALACWAVPGLALGLPALTLLGGCVLLLAGAAARYASAAHPAAFELGAEGAKGLLVPAVGLVAGCARQPLAVFLLPATVAVLVGLPLRLGWCMMEGLPAAHNAKMGTAGAFNRAGVADEL